eukprot:1206346-Alexandrium_andersonii.AAC.1
MSQNALILNYGVGKSAAIAAFRGPGSKPLRCRYMSEASPTLPVQAANGTRQLSVTYAYRHMGGQITATGAPALE